MRTEKTIAGTHHLSEELLSVGLLLEYTALKYIRAYKDWMNTKSQRDWQVVEIYSDIISKAGTDLSLLRSMALTNQIN